MLHESPDLTGKFDSPFNFFLLDELSPRDGVEGRCTSSVPDMTFAGDGPSGEYYLLEDGSIGYYSSEREAGRPTESMDNLFSLLVSYTCWYDRCGAKQYVNSKTLEEYEQRQYDYNLEDVNVDSLRRVSDTPGTPTGESLASVLERFHRATQRESIYQCVFHKDDGSLAEPCNLMFE